MKDASTKSRTYNDEYGAKYTALLDKLRPYAENLSRGTFRKGGLFSLCLKASFAKCYEFCYSAHCDARDSRAFFLVATLRSICEDLIVLSFIGNMPRVDREQLITLLMRHGVNSKTRVQEQFFAVAKPDQPVLTPRLTLREQEVLEDEIWKIWRSHGLSKRPGVVPSVKKMAERHRLDVLSTLYEFLYQLSSGTVHFNPAALLRLGWGTRRRPRFSTGNLGPYYLAFARIYSLYMPAAYFELFGIYMKPGKGNQEIVADIRLSLFLEARWPEIVTFEEMNLPVPDEHVLPRLVIRVANAEARKHGLLKRR